MNHLFFAILILTSHSAFACIAKNYEFGNISLSSEGQLTQVFAGPADAPEYQSITLRNGDKVELNANGTGRGQQQDVSHKLAAKLVSTKQTLTAPRGSSGTVTAVYEVVEKTIQYETRSGKPETRVRNATVTVSRQLGTRGMEADNSANCGSVTATYHR